MKKWISALTIVSALACASQAWASPADSDVADQPLSNIASYRSTSLIKTDGSLWVWGDRQHSVPTHMFGLTDVAAAFPEHFITKKDGTVEYWTADAHNASIANPVPVPALRQIIDMAYLNETELALDASGQVFQITAPNMQPDLNTIEPLTGVDNIKQMSVYVEYGDHYSSADFIALLLKQDGTVLFWDQTLGSVMPVPGLHNITSLAYRCALQEDGTVWMFPDIVKDHGKPSASPLQGMSNIQRMGSNFDSYWGIDKEQQLWFWGDTITGWSDGTAYIDNAPVKLTEVSSVKDAAIFERSIVALDNNGTVLEASIDQEQMSASTPFRSLAKSVFSMQSGTRHLIMQQKTGSMISFGFGMHGQLGNGSFEQWFDNAVSVERAVDVALNGELLPLSNGVIIRAGQTFVPLRSVFEKLGATLSFDNSTKTVTIKRTGDTSLTLTIDTKTASAQLNGQPVTMPGQIPIVGGSVYLPLRFISETLGATVEWSAQDDRVNISMQ